jgi:hypothetical protein
MPLIESYAAFTKNRRFFDRWVKTYSVQPFWLKTVRYDFPNLDATFQSVFKDKIITVKITSNEATLKLVPADDLLGKPLSTLIVRGVETDCYVVRDIMKLARQADFAALAAIIKSKYKKMEAYAS